MNRDLELAKRVFPDRGWVQLNASDVWAVEDYPGGIRRDAIAFDPLGKHFPDVLAWLLLRDQYNELDGQRVLAFLKPEDEYGIVVEHNGTADGLAQAVYEAAIRIVEA